MSKQVEQEVGFKNLPTYFLPASRATLPSAMRRFAIITILSLAPLTSFAAEDTGTGASLFERIGALRTHIETRIPANTGALLPNATKQKAWDAEKARHEQRIWEQRAKCREEIRKANRDTIVSKSAQCFRSDLMEELALRRKEKTFVESLPAIDPQALASYSAAVTALMDAQAAIVDGIDTNVYSTVELLQTAKRKLRDQYRTPYWTAFFRLTADRLIPWTAWQVDRMEGLLSEEPETAAEAQVACLEETTNLLAIAKNAPFETALANLKTALARSRECAATLRILVEAEG